MNTTLRGQGVAVLLAYWAELYPPGRGQPGVECSGEGEVTVRVIGYRCPTDRRRALNQAAAVCEDAGLVVAHLSGGFSVRRRTGGAS